MTKLARWTLATALAALATAAPADASFLQEVGSPFAVGTAPFGVLTADFDHDADKRPDVIAINGTTSTATLILRQAAGGFRQEGATTVAGGPNFGAVADFNRDGWPDFAAGGYSGAGALSVHLRKSTGGFDPAVGTPITTVGKLGAVAAADFDGDGRADIAVAKYDTGGITTLLQQVNGSFVAEAGTAPTGANPRYIAVTDFNGDGRPDLAVSNLAAGQANGSLTILLRKPTGGFEQETGSPIKVGKSPVMVATGDFNGDSRTDVAVANAESESVTIFTRVAAGGFSPMAEIPTANPVGVVSADFNRDGATDLAVTNSKPNTVSVFLRQPNGTFGLDAGSPIPTGALPYGIAAADFNGDSKPDLAIANSGAASLTVLLNTTPDPVVVTPPVVQPPVVNPAPIVNTPPAPRINARLTLAWTVFRNYVALDSASLKDLPVGATVKITCSTCKTKSLTLTSKKSTLTLSKLRGAKLKRGKTFTVTITKPGYVGLSMTRKVKNYGRTLKAMKKAVKAPFSETRGCVPVGATKPAKTC